MSLDEYHARQRQNDLGNQLREIRGRIEAKGWANLTLDEIHARLAEGDGTVPTDESGEKLSTPMPEPSAPAEPTNEGLAELLDRMATYADDETEAGGGELRLAAQRLREAERTGHDPEVCAAVDQIRIDLQAERDRLQQELDALEALHENACGEWHRERDRLREALEDSNSLLESLSEGEVAEQIDDQVEANRRALGESQEEG